MMNCKIDLTCPVEIFRIALPTEEIPAASMTLFNVSDRVVSSVEVLLRLLDGEGSETERLSFRGRALNGRPHSTFLLTVPCAPSDGLKALDVQIEKVWFSDNDIWRQNPENMVEYTPNALPVSPALTNLKFAAGETAVGYPSLQDGLWVCVCGRPNSRDDHYCTRCGRQMETVFSLFTPEAVETQISMKERQMDLSSRNIREDTIRMQRIREEEFKRKRVRRNNRLRIAAAMVFSVVLTACVLFFLEPMLRLSAGKRALETGDAAGAKRAFQALGSFGGANELIPECDWILALKAAEDATTIEELDDASALLHAVKDRPEATDKANETDFLRARLLLGNNRWAEALEALALLPEEYEGRAELEQSCLTAKAWTLQNAGQYAEAREVWLLLGDMPGAREQAAQCIYEPAKALMEEEDWDGAIDMFSTIPDYQDSREKTLECHYHKAKELYDTGDTEGACREYLLAGSWGDALKQYNSLTYEQAEALYTAGDIKGAQTLYASIPDFEDANAKNTACCYQLAKDAASILEYTSVLELLKEVPDDYKNTKALREEASYKKAQIAFRQEDWNTVVELLGDLDRGNLKRKYRDIENLYLEACSKAGTVPSSRKQEPDEVAAETKETPAPAEKNTPTVTQDPFLVTEDEP